jgi:phenylalanyl-tRNA synthetase beta chain
VKATDYHYAQAVVQKILTRASINGLTPQLHEDAAFEQAYSIKRGDKQIAVFGAVKGDYLQLAGIKQPVFYAEFNLEYILRMYSSGLTYKEFSRFPEVRRDLSLVLDKKVTFEEISKVVRKVEKKLLADLNVFDVYEGKNIGEDKKSYSISFTLIDAEQTLTDKVIESTMDKLMKALETDLGAVIRK